MSVMSLAPSCELRLAGFDHSGPPSPASALRGRLRAAERSRDDEESEDFDEPTEVEADRPLPNWEDDPFDDDEAEPAPGDFWLDPDDYDREEI